jgi:hypothetical protein
MKIIKLQETQTFQSFEDLKTRNTELLVGLGVDSNKIRFTPDPTNFYNITQNIVGTENFAPGDISRCLNLQVVSKKIEDIRSEINNSQRGYLFQLENNNHLRFELDTEKIRFINIDEEVERWKLKEKI